VFDYYKFKKGTLVSLKDRTEQKTITRRHKQHLKIFL